MPIASEHRAFQLSSICARIPGTPPPGFGADHDPPYAELCRIDPRFLPREFREVDGVGRRRREHVGLHGANGRDEAVGCAGADGEQRCADGLDGGGHRQAADEEPDAEPHREDALRTKPLRPVAARDALGPASLVMLGQADEGGRSGRARGGMDTDHVFHRGRGVASERGVLPLAFPQLGLLGEGQPGQVREGADVARFRPRLGQLLRMKRRVRLEVFELSAEFPVLHCGGLVGRHRLDRGVEIGALGLPHRHAPAQFAHSSPAHRPSENSGLPSLRKPRRPGVEIGDGGDAPAAVERARGSGKREASCGSDTGSACSR